MAFCRVRRDRFFVRCFPDGGICAAVCNSLAWTNIARASRYSRFAWISMGIVNTYLVKLRLNLIASHLESIFTLDPFLVNFSIFHIFTFVKSPYPRLLLIHILG